LSFVDTIAFDGKLALAKVRIETGRTHQIRVHLKDRRTPIYGDDVYGITEWNKILLKSAGISRPLLHAYRLKLHHPIYTERVMEFVAPMDVQMSGVARAIYSKRTSNIGGEGDGEGDDPTPKDFDVDDDDDDDLQMAFQDCE
jgi:23S rRNA pseudouridine1911/1915/1917 synthase